MTGDRRGRARRTGQGGRVRGGRRSAGGGSLTNEGAQTSSKLVEEQGGIAKMNHI